MNTSTTLPVAAATPPPGVHSNFVDPPTIAPAIISALTVCLVVSTVSVTARCVAPWALFKRLVWADYWNLFGWMFQAAFTGTLAACIPYGAGRHLWDVKKTDFSHINFLLFINFILYGCAILGPKMSILLQLVSIFVPRGRSLATSARIFYWASIFMMAVNLIYYIAHNIALIWQCKPIAKGWNKTLPGTCINQDALLLSSGPFNIVSDFLIFLLPLSVVWQLQLPVKTRLEIASAFTVGLFGCLCSAARVYYSNQLSQSHDTTVLTFQNQLWANAEVTAATVIASIIILPRFIRFKREPKSYQSPMGDSRTSYGTSKTKSNGSKQRSMGPRQCSSCAQRVPLNESYADVESGYGKHPQAMAQMGRDGHIDGAQTPGIVRTIEIDTFSDKVRPPSPAKLHNLRPPEPERAPSSNNKTRWYSDEDEV